MEIKDYHIEMLSVGAADAFIIYIIDENDRERLILIDSGNYSNGQKIINHIRKYYNNPVIDLAIVTHPDDDHYGGFIKMLEKIQGQDKDAIKIETFWVNDPGNNHIDVEDVRNGRKQAPVNQRAQRVYDLKNSNLLDLIEEQNIPSYEIFSDVIVSRMPPVRNLTYDDVISKFPGATIIGPTKQYYERLIPNFRDDLIHYDNENENTYDPNSDIQDGECLSPALDCAVDDQSAHNQSSIMILFEPKAGKKYFFMGDAGRDAFDNIDRYLKTKVKEISWLKVPHHGSKHNMDSVMINWLKPKTAYISAEKIGNYVNQCTINALKRSKCNVYSTHVDAANFIHKQIGAREGYSTAEPL